MCGVCYVLRNHMRWLRSHDSINQSVLRVRDSTKTTFVFSRIIYKEPSFGSFVYDCSDFLIWLLCCGGFFATYVYWRSNSLTHIFLNCWIGPTTWPADQIVLLMLSSTVWSREFNPTMTETFKFYLSVLRMLSEKKLCRTFIWLFFKCRRSFVSQFRATSVWPKIPRIPQGKQTKWQLPVRFRIPRNLHTLCQLLMWLMTICIGEIVFFLNQQLLKLFY
jgi:hypothetical protein